MPDDEITKDIAEQDKEEQEAEATFDKDEGDNEDSTKDDDDGTTPDDEKDTGTDDDDDDGKDDKKPTPKEIAEHRAGITKEKSEGTNNPLFTFLSEESPEEPEPDDKDTKKPDKEDDKKPSLDPDDDEFDEDEYKAAYPEDYNAIKKVAKRMVAEIMGKTGQDVNYITREEFEHERAQGRLETEVRRIHPDAESITAMDDNGNLLDETFAGWINEQPKAIQRLFVVADKDILTAAEDFSVGLDYYKDETKKKQANDHDDNARKAKKKKDDLHGNTMRSKKAKRKSDKSEADEEKAAEKIFNED